MNELIDKMERVREHVHGNEVSLQRHAATERLVVVAHTNAGHHVELDLFDILTWLHAAGLVQLRLETPSDQAV